jgi:hypothetical protein
LVRYIPAVDGKMTEKFYSVTLKDDSNLRRSFGPFSYFS